MNLWLILLCVWLVSSAFLLVLILWELKARPRENEGPVTTGAETAEPEPDGSAIEAAGMEPTRQTLQLQKSGIDETDAFAVEARGLAHVSESAD